MPIINEAEAIHNARPHHFLYTQDPSHGPLWYTDKLGEGPVFMTCYSFVATLILRVHIRSFGVFEDGVQHDLSNCGIARYFDKYGPRSFVGALQQHLVRKPQSGIPLCTGRLLNGWTNYLVRGDILLFAGPPHKNKEAGPSEVWHAACVETPNNHDGSKTVVRDMGAPRLCLCKSPPSDTGIQRRTLSTIIKAAGVQDKEFSVQVWSVDAQELVSTCARRHQRA